MGISILIPRAFGAAILVYLILVIIGFRKKELVFRLDTISVLFILLYLAYAVGVFFSRDTGQAMSYLEYKLSFIVLPLLLAFRLRTGNFELRRIAQGLIIGVFLAALYGVGNSALCYLHEGSWACFLTGSVSPLHHPSYFMTYLIVAMLLAWMGWYLKWKYFTLWWVIPFTLFGLVLHVLSLSLAGILFMLIAMTGVVLYGIYRKWGKWMALGAVVVLPLVAYLFVTRVPQVEGEWNGAKWYAEEYMKDPEGFVRNTPYPMSGSEQRLILWTVAWRELKEHPMGVGTGNLDEVLGNGLRELGQEELAEKNMNPHNQFLQTGLEIGIFGLLLLLGILTYSFWLAFRMRSGLLLLIAGCLSFNSLFESMLQRQSGVVFFTFWLCLLPIILRNSPKELVPDHQEG